MRFSLAGPNRVFRKIYEDWCEKVAEDGLGSCESVGEDKQLTSRLQKG